MACLSVEFPGENQPNEAFESTSAMSVSYVTSDLIAQYSLIWAIHSISCLKRSVAVSVRPRYAFEAAQDGCHTAVLVQFVVNDVSALAILPERVRISLGNLGDNFPSYYPLSKQAL